MFCASTLMSFSPNYSVKLKMIKNQLLSLLSAVAILSSVAFAQSKAETITNASVIEMVKLGLGETLIIAKIKSSNCQCDTSMPAISQLKAARVSDTIILAMMGASNGNSTTTERPAASESADMKEMREPGIYVDDGSKKTAIEPTVFSGTKANFLKSGLTYGIMKTKFRAKVRGKSANLATSTGVSFYFVFNPAYQNSGATMAGGYWWGMPATSPAEFVLVEMQVKDASREAVMGEYGTFTGMSTGARDKDIREFSFEKISPGVYKVTPKATLATGEYCFYYAATVAGLGFAGGKVFDFSIR